MPKLGESGKYGKGILNSNGKELLEFCNRQSLILTNTLFRHKMAHRATWESPANYSEHNRRNPYRNLIDYIIVRKSQKHTIHDSRSHNGLMTYTDHRPVRAKMNLEKIHINRDKKSFPRDLEQLQDQTIRARYAVNMEMKIMDIDDARRENNTQVTAQEQWNDIVTCSIKAAEETLGKKRRQGNRQNEMVAKLSEDQKKIYNQINTTNDEKERKQLKRERNNKMTEIHKELAKEKTRQIENEIKEIEEAKDDSNRMYKAVKAIQRMKPKVQLTVEDGDGVTTDTSRQIDIISAFFGNMFHSTNSAEIADIPPKEIVV